MIRKGYSAISRIIRKAEATVGFFDHNMERELIRLAQGSGRDSERARDLLVHRNIGIVHNAAKHITNQDDHDDAVAAGVHGFIAAIEGFNLAKGGRLSTIATIVVKQHIRRWTFSTSRAIRLPEYVHTRIRKIPRAYAILKRANGVEPTDVEIDRFYGWDEGTTADLRELDYTRMVSVSTPVSEDERVSLGDLIPATEHLPETVLAGLVTSAKVEQLLHVLTPRDREVIERLFGLGEYSEHTQVEIAEAVGVSKQRVNQIIQKALEEMKVRGDIQ